MQINVHFIIEESKKIHDFPPIILLSKYKLCKLWLKEQQQKHRRHHQQIFINTTTAEKRNLILLYFNTQWLWSYLLLLWQGGLERMDGK